MTYADLLAFLTHTMRMQHIYQPLLIRTLVESGGTATLRQLAQAFVLQDESQLRYYEDRVKAMPLQVLKGHGIVEERDGLVSLNIESLTYVQRAQIKALCEQKLGEYVAEHGMEIWDYKTQVAGHESRVTSQRTDTTAKEEVAASQAAEAVPEYRPHPYPMRKPIKGAAHRNPPWNRDELILALDLYFRVEPSKIDDTHPDVMALSIILNLLPVPEGKIDLSYRNPNGVALKLQNFRTLDPAQEGKGMSHGGRMDAEIWREFARDRGKLREAAGEILLKTING